MEKSTFTLPISPKKIAFLLFGFILFLTVASLIGQYYKDFFADNELLIKIIDKFDLDLEKNNVPTWYQSSSLLLSSFLLLVISLFRNSEGDKDYRFWGLLSAIFLYLSLDEAVSIHEQLTMPLRTTFQLEGIFYLSWVIPAVAFLAVFALVFFKFLFRLPPQTRYLMMTAGIVFVLGAVGVEMLGGNYLYVTDDLPTRINDFRYVLLTTFEEFLEMSGIVIFIYSLLSYLFPSEAPETVNEKAKIIESFDRKVALSK
jgi:hypothetical protein